MKIISNLLFLVFGTLFFVISCDKKGNEKSDLEKLRQSNNKKSYPVTKMDSLQAIQFITKQKIQELYDLSALYTSGNKDTEIDSVIYEQMMGYFAQPDSTKMANTLKEMDSLKVKEAKVGNIEVNKNIWKIYTNLPKETQQNEELIALMRKIDQQFNVDWCLSHYKSAVKYLQKTPEDIKATGGTNWQQYLPPKFQRIQFFPDLLSPQEKEEWGKAWVDSVIGKK